jgi:hypothetical protein
MEFSTYQYNAGDPLSTNITAMTLPDASDFEIAGLVYPWVNESAYRDNSFYKHIFSTVIYAGHIAHEMCFQEILLPWPQV